jgi:hypothetical protein
MAWVGVGAWQAARINTVKNEKTTNFLMHSRIIFPFGMLPVNSGGTIL